MAQFTNQAQLSYNNRVITSNVVIGEILPLLFATKTAVSSVYTANDTVTYVVSILNSGNEEVCGLTLTDDLGAYDFAAQSIVPLDYVEGSVKYYANGVLLPAPTVSAGAELVISDICVPAGGNSTVVYEARVNQFAPLDAGASITNTVTVASSTVSAITAEETVTASNEPQLTISKSISPVPVSDSGTLTYTFVIQNYGNSPADAADGVVVSDLFSPILDNIVVSFNGQLLTEGVDYSYSADGLFETTPGRITVPAASYEQNPQTGAFSTVPGTSTLVITGTV